MEIIFNSNITRIKVYKKAICLHYQVKAYKNKIGVKYLFIPIYEEIKGVYKFWTDKYVCDLIDFNKKSEDYFFENDGFYYKPHVEIYTNDGGKREKFFKTVEELNEYVEELKSLAPHIILD
jgi:hypothetical protein